MLAWSRIIILTLLSTLSMSGFEVGFDQASRPPMNRTGYRLAWFHKFASQELVIFGGFGRNE